MEVSEINSSVIRSWWLHLLLWIGVHANLLQCGPIGMLCVRCWIASDFYHTKDIRGFIPNFLTWLLCEQTNFWSGYWKPYITARACGLWFFVFNWMYFQQKYVWKGEEISTAFFHTGLCVLTCSVCYSEKCKWVPVLTCSFPSDLGKSSVSTS